MQVYEDHDVAAALRLPLMNLDRTLGLVEAFCQNTHKRLILDTRNLGLLISLYVFTSEICIGQGMFATPTLARLCPVPPLLMRIVPSI